MAVEETLTTLLAGSGHSVHILQKALTMPAPAIVFRRISRREWKSHAATKLAARERWQIVCMAEDYTTMRTLRDGVDEKLWCNRTDFMFSEPAGPEVNLPDDRDGKLRITARDYYIWPN